MAGVVGRPAAVGCEALSELLPPNLSGIARGLGLSRQAVAGWRQVPAERVRRVSELTGIPAWRLRPDLFAEPDR